MPPATFLSFSLFYVLVGREKNKILFDPRLSLKVEPYLAGAAAAARMQGGK